MPTATSVPLLRWPVFAAVAALVVAWVGFAVLRAPDNSTEPPPLNRNIVSSLWTVPITGGRPRLLLRDRGSQDVFPRYRRDGSVMFVRPKKLAGADLFATLPNGGVRRLRGLPQFSQFAYSPRTDEIARVRGRKVEAESLSGGGKRVLAEVPGPQPGSVVWSADGSTLVLARSQPVGVGPQHYRPEFVVIRGRRARVFRLDAGAPGPLAISPDGDRLVFSWGRQLFLFDTRTGRRRLFANSASFVVAWSPDGGTVAYVEREALVTRDLRTNRRRVLVPKVRGSLGSFSPDGGAIVYVTQKLN